MGIFSLPQQPPGTGGTPDTMINVSRPGQRGALPPRGQLSMTAGGGRVSGPGGPTSDRIHALLSNGEFVLPADTVKAIGKKALNALVASTHKPAPVRTKGAIQKMADGGELDPSQSLSSLSSRGMVGLAAPNELQSVAVPTPSAAPSYGTAAPLTQAPAASASIGRLANVPTAGGSQSPWGEQTGQLGWVPAAGGAQSPWEAQPAAAPLQPPRIAPPPAFDWMPRSKPVAGYADGGEVDPDEERRRALGVGATTFVAPVDQTNPGPTYRYDPGRPAPAGTIFQSPWVPENAPAPPPPIFAQPAPPPALGPLPSPRLLGSADSQADRLYGAERARAPRVNPYGVGPEQPTAYGADDAFAFRDRVRGGAAPLAPQGIGGSPGAQITKDYGLGGPSIVATADKTGRFNSFSQGPNAPGGSPAVADAGGMTTEDANAYYGAQLRAMRANEAQNKAAADQSSMLLTRALEGQLGADHAKWAAQVDNSRSRLSVGGRGGDNSAASRANSTEVANGARSLANTARAAYEATLGGPPLAAQNQLVQNAGEQAQRGITARNAGRLAQAEGQQALAQRALLNPLAVESAKQGVQRGAGEITMQNLAVANQQHVTDLQKRALGTGPDANHANDMLALYHKAISGKGGPITDEDKLKVYGDMLSRAAAMGPDAYKQLPNFHEFSATLTPGHSTQPPKDQALTEAKAAIAKGADKAAVNARLQAWGYGSL